MKFHFNSPFQAGVRLRSCSSVSNRPEGGFFMIGRRPVLIVFVRKSLDAICVQTLFSVQPIERRILFVGKYRCENLTRLHSSFWGIWPEIVSLNGVLSSAHLPMQVKYTRRSVGRKRIRRIFTKIPAEYRAPIARLDV